MYRTETYDRSHSHSLDTVAGYRVIRTDWTGGPVHRELVTEVEGATNYARALELMHQVRHEASAQQYAVIDNVYACGCGSVTAEDDLDNFDLYEGATDEERQAGYAEATAVRQRMERRRADLDAAEMTPTERVIDASRNWQAAGAPVHTFSPLPEPAGHYCQHCGSGRLGWQHN